ncbi:MAG: ATP-binding protein [Oscillospiraceae bacterium]|nr:ATP-binding protein [Oscillospiraceae bacterium]
MNRLTDLAGRLAGIAVFRNVLKLGTMSRLLNMLKEQTNDACGEFVNSLYKHGADISAYIAKAVTEDENCYLLRKAKRQQVPPVMEEAARRELLLFEEISMLTTEDVRTAMGYMGYLPGWVNTHYDFVSMYAERIDRLFTVGYGIFAKYTAFMYKNNAIEPVLTPDTGRLCDLTAYEAQRKKALDNALALIKGKPAANCLLYGDAGTGKSSTVKAVVNELADRGLRLIELKRPQLHELPDIMEAIADNPLKFIIFIDDLSFASDDENFGTLKAVLEGSVSARVSNAVIYATSNRRHLVRESFSDRDGDDIHARDTREELASLSERFGLKITFLKPDKETYLKIVESLAEKYGVKCDREELFTKAEAYALRRSGRSGRAARHFVEMLKAEE